MILSIVAVALLTTITDAQFAIDYEHNTFTMDGKPFQYISGSMHYFRCPRVYWRDRLRKLREAGLNAVSTYVEWSQHERIPGKYDFTGELDLKEFIRIAKEEDLYVILRPGPYICAERDMGGLPYWLLKFNPQVKLRTADPSYTTYVQRWLDVLMPEIEPLLYGNGGPIIMVQVENEYGSYPACDKTYLTWLRDILRSYVGDKAVLFTTDGAATNFLKCGKIPEVYATVDFGPGINATTAFAFQRSFEPKGPLVNSEFYPGWLTHWGEPIAQTEIQPIVDTLKLMLQMGANINFYMFHGGSNFGFTAGANFGNTYQSDITSYDYDAPLTEAGDITPKYNAIQDVLFNYFPERKRPKRQQAVAPKGAYGAVTLMKTANLLSKELRKTMGAEFSSEYPKTFEYLSQNFGYLLYETTIANKVTKEPSELEISKFSDRAIVYVNGSYMRALSREQKSTKMSIVVQTGDVLSILVENLGRINYGQYNNDSKGILSNVTLNGNVLSPWKMTKYELDTIDPVMKCLAPNVNPCIDNSPINVYVTSFLIPENFTQAVLPDTFLDVSPLKKGLVFVNGHNLGRYWTKRGPQYSLYVPGSYLISRKEGSNILVVLDEQIKADNITVNFSDVPIWGKNTKIVKPYG